MASQGNNGNYYAVEEGKYLRLYKAIVQANWEEAQNLLSINQNDNNNKIIAAPLNNNLDTALHVAAKGDGRHVSFAEKLVAELPEDDDDEALLLPNRKGLAPLHLAARYGNIGVAKILVRRNSHLLYHTSHEGLLPIHYAAQNALNSVEVYRYFLSVTKDDEDGEANPYGGPSGATILVNLIKSKFYVVAMELADKYPDLTLHRTLDKEISPLEAIVKYDYPIFHKTNLHFWQTSIQYGHYGFGKTHMWSPSPVEKATYWSPSLRRRRPWSSSPYQRPFIAFLSKMSVEEKMLKHEEAVKLVKCLCDKLKILNGTQVASIAKEAIIEAAYLDIEEVVENIVETYPTTAYYKDKSGRNILHIAVESRSTNVFNYLVCGSYNNSVLKHDLVDERDNNGNNIVHLAGKLAPPHKLNSTPRSINVFNLVSGATLQMQREMQWFKEVQKIAPPYFSSLRNKDDKTPKMVFTDEHKDLKKEGERWMKETAAACSIVAALITTVVFAAAITVPGGNSDGVLTQGFNATIFPPAANNVSVNGTIKGPIDETPPEGLPIFSRKDAFRTFYIFNSVSLFTSVPSLLLFLSILTSRYSDEDFLRTLPVKLILGLLTLLSSVFFMMASFATTVYLVFGKTVLSVRIVLMVVTGLTVGSVVLLQFRLLLAFLWSTYGQAILKKLIPARNLF